MLPYADNRPAVREQPTVHGLSAVRRKRPRCLPWMQSTSAGTSRRPTRAFFHWLACTSFWAGRRCGGWENGKTDATNTVSGKRTGWARETRSEETLWTVSRTQWCEWSAQRVCRTSENYKDWELKCTVMATSGRVRDNQTPKNTTGRQQQTNCGMPVNNIIDAVQSTGDPYVRARASARSLVKGRVEKMLQLAVIYVVFTGQCENARSAFDICCSPVVREGPYRRDLITVISVPSGGGNRLRLRRDIVVTTYTPLAQCWSRVSTVLGQ